ncbi:prolipoprotein diacylglyceryl transferase [archaeon]|nr:MAG: prolipoprotein diacylglyceryl transferase [archaeon]
MHPILIRVGSVTVHYYGLMYVIAITVGFCLFTREARHKGLSLSTDDRLGLFLWLIPLAIIGARFYYVAFRWGYYSCHLVDMIKLWQGGLAIHGGVIVGITVVYLFSRVKTVPFWSLTDALSPSLILGQAIGRIGNLMNGDAYGLPTNLPWGIRFPSHSPAGRAYPGLATHPSMVYEMLLDLVIFILLWRVRNKGYRDGFSTAMYFILYSLARFLVSFTRGDSLWLGPIRVAHVISVILVIGFSLLVFVRRLYQHDAGAEGGL